MINIMLPYGLQTTQHTSGGAVTAVLASCCENCVEISRNGGPMFYRFFLGKPAMRTR